jgi:hypothetical protein
MEFRALYLLSYFIACAYVTAWLARLGSGAYEWLRKGGLVRLMEGQKTSLNPIKNILTWNNTLLCMSGAIFGWSVISWIGAWFVREWLLLILTGSAILINDLRLSTKEINLFSVMALITGLHKEKNISPDLFERFAGILDGLPPGDVQKSVREVIQRRRSGSTVGGSFQVLNGLHPLLNELVFTLRLAGWRTSPAFDLALERLSQRAGRKWDRLSRSMAFREQIRPLLQFGQAAILAALFDLVIEDISSFTFAWPSYAIIFWIGLGLLLAALVLYAAFHHAWLRRFLGVGLLIASMIPFWRHANLPRLFELQVNSVSHWSGTVSRHKVDKVPVPTAVPDPSISIPFKEEQLVNADAIIQPTAMPSLPTFIGGRLEPTPLPLQNRVKEKSWKTPCCRPR